LVHPPGRDAFPSPFLLSHCSAASPCGHLPRCRRSSHQGPARARPKPSRHLRPPLPRTSEARPPLPLHPDVCLDLATTLLAGPDPSPGSLLGLAAGGAGDLAMTIAGVGGLAAATAGTPGSGNLSFRRRPASRPLLRFAAPCHCASHLLIARADAPAEPPTSSFSRHWCRQHPLPAPAQAPARLDPPPRPPLLHRLRWIRRCRGLPDWIPVAATLPARSLVPLAGSRLPGWIRRCRGLPGRIYRFPFYSTAGANTMIGADACAAVGLPGGAP
jgi:hypothetical protein